jgi:hypothetical protein
MALVEPPTELVMDAAFVRHEGWSATLLATLGVGGRIVVRPETADRPSRSTE